MPDGSFNLTENPIISRVPASTATSTVESVIMTPDYGAQLIRVKWREPVDIVMQPLETGVLEMCLTPRPPDSQAAFVIRGDSDPFRPIGGIAFWPADIPIRVQSGIGVQRSGPAGQHVLLCQLWMTTPWDPKQIDQGRLYAGLDLHLPAVRSAFLRLSQELLHQGFASDVVVDALARILVVDIARFHGAGGSGEPTYRGGLAPWRLRRVCERISDDGRPPTVAELAGLCGCSRRHLIRSFRESRGETLGQYIARVRIERAKRLLAGDEAIAQIATALGFASPSSFSSAFRAAVGSAPREYRVMIRTR